MFTNEIVACSGWSRNTVDLILKAAKNLPHNTAPIHKCPPGKPRVTSKATDNFLSLLMFRRPFMTVPESKILHLEILRNASVVTPWRTPKKRS